MEVITDKSQLLENVSRLQDYVRTSGSDRQFAVDLIRNGICFVITEADGRPFFSPSRFVGYRCNSRHGHAHNENKDGRETNTALEAILHGPALESDLLEREYEQFCVALGTSVRKPPFNSPRRFWDLR